MRCLDSDFQDYMSTVRSVARPLCRDGELYGGAEGCKRYAREFGACLPDFSRDERDIQRMAQSTYGALCVISYSLRPPIDARQWHVELMKGVKKRFEVDAEQAMRRVKMKEA